MKLPSTLNSVLRPLSCAVGPRRQDCVAIGLSVGPHSYVTYWSADYNLLGSAR